MAAKRVQGVKGKTATKEKPEPKKRPKYMSTDLAKEHMNGDGLLTAIPDNYDSKEHLAPKRADFASEDLFLEFKANEFESRAEGLATKAARLREQAETIRKFGDPEQRKKVAKFQKMQAQISELQKALEAEGISLDELMDEDEEEEN